MVGSLASGVGVENMERVWIKPQRWVGVGPAAGQSREPRSNGSSSLACWPMCAWLKTNDVQPVTMVMM